MMKSEFWMGHGWGWIGMGLAWLILILLVLVAFKYLTSRSAPPGEAAKTSMDYLDESYARGEISRDEFLQKREDLSRK